MERNRKEQEQILQAKIEWERTVDAMPDMIAVVASDFTIVRVNRAMCEKTGKSYAELLGSKCYEWAHGTPSPPEFCPHLAMLEDLKPHRAEFYEERLGGHCQAMVVPSFDSAGKFVGAVHVIRDINDQKNAEQARDRMQTELLQAQKLESVGRLAAGIAHEINTPAQFVGTNIEFLQESFEDISRFVQTVGALASGKEALSRERLREVLEELDWEYLAEELPAALSQSRDGIGRISSIVRAMKEFAHPGSREKVAQDLNEIVKTAVTVARNEWKYVAEVVYELEPDLKKVPVLSDEIGQVILNLLVNSAHAIAEKLGDNPGETKGRITISSKNCEDGVEITVSDTGAGIEKAVLSKIFDPFFTTKEQGRGTGQGLAISHNVIVEKHGGAIDVCSSPGEGTTFTLKLPG